MFRVIFTSHKAVLKIAVIVESNWQSKRLMGRMIGKKDIVLEAMESVDDNDRDDDDRNVDENTPPE